MDDAFSNELLYTVEDPEYLSSERCSEQGEKRVAKNLKWGNNKDSKIMIEKAENYVSVRRFCG